MGHQLNLPTIDRKYQRRFTALLSLGAAFLVLAVGFFMVNDVAGRENSRTAVKDDFQPMQLQDSEVHGAKWNDLDGDGFWGIGELGLPGWRIEIAGPDQFTDTTVTDDNGLYSFTGLPAGNYIVTEQLVPGWIQT
jgi:hypothetical protein